MPGENFRASDVADAVRVGAGEGVSRDDGGTAEHPERTATASAIVDAAMNLIIMIMTIWWWLTVGGIGVA
jgi:hypothetical protein